MNNPQNFPQHWVLIRGLTRSHFHWFDFKSLLLKKLNIESVECPELAGNGYLSDLKTPQSLSLCVAQLRSQLKHHDEPIGLIGISLGGIIATQWATEFPEEVSHLVLINSSFSMCPAHRRLRYQNYFKILLTLLFPSPKRIENFILKNTANTADIKNYLETCIDFQKKHPVQLLNLIRQLRLTQQAHFPIKPRCVVLILAAVSDRLVDYRCSLFIAKHWSVSAEIHPSAGHDLTLDDPFWVLEKIRKLNESS